MFVSYMYVYKYYVKLKNMNINKIEFIWISKVRIRVVRISEGLLIVR